MTTREVTAVHSFFPAVVAFTPRSHRSSVTFPVKKPDLAAVCDALVRPRYFIRLLSLP